MGARMVSITVTRFDPDTHAGPRQETHQVPDAEGAMLLDALEHIREHDDPSLRFRHSCHMGKCGTCAVQVDGAPVLACWERLRDGMVVEPLANLPVLADVVVDRQQVDRRFDGVTFVPAAAPSAEQAGALAIAPRPALLARAHNCLQCFSCVSVCPYQPIPKRTFVGPKYMVDVARLASDPRARHDAVLDAAVRMGTWDCVTCLACTSVCPADVDPMRQVIDVRRHLIDSTAPGRVPSTIGVLNDRLHKHGSPWGTPRPKRGAWAKGLGLEDVSKGERASTVYLTGCYDGGDVAGGATARTIAWLLQHAGEDIAVFGGKENCCGDPARSTGEEYLFEDVRQRNARAMRDTGAAAAVTPCPHAFDVYRHEGAIDGLAVRHYTEVLAGAVRDGRLVLHARPLERVTYHDACYLGRFNGVYEAPRELLRAVPGLTLVEMTEARERAKCCGGGGGAVFSDPDATPRLSEQRVAQAIATGATTLAVACQFCYTMFADAITTMQAAISVRHIADIVGEAAGAPTGDMG